MARILVAEDDPFVASFLEKGLRSHGFTPFVVDNGEHAQELSLSGAFDLLLLGVELPRRNGSMCSRSFEAAAARCRSWCSPLRPQDHDVVACLRAGADDYMAKPFRVDEPPCPHPDEAPQVRHH